MHLSYYALTHRGPREENEDAYGVYATYSLLVGVVADGVGGNPGGSVASKLAVQEVISFFKSLEKPKPDHLKEALIMANSRIRKEQAINPSLSRMATTCTAVMVKDKKLHISHVGDSRVYLFRNGDLVRLTQDHSMHNTNVLLNALGIKNDVDIDSEVLNLYSKDTILLCTDGLYKVLQHDVMEKIITESKDPEDVAHRLMEQASKKGLIDNTTLLIVSID
ncbi:MAG: protein phosphatase 2C domain-containing protein [Hydrogenobacter thermophilus]|uniref:PP2C family protein-serine/threonine phosphatase n=1 Tax=Hydrogenobacter thermophilus TaxID=940 RepID=UPI0030FD175F|nr:protein phosphatase 2C domain-containing protein [Hydrogenobacter thermophilus]